MTAADSGRSGVLLAVCLGLGACAQQPFDYHSGREIPQGPGMMTGEDGRAVLYRSADSAASTPGAAASHTEPSPSFEAYRAYMAWRDTAPGTPEYEEFLQWLEWQEYRAAD